MPSPADARHLLASIVLTAAALGAAFALPTTAHAWGFTIVTDDGDGKGLVGSGHRADVHRTVPAFSRLRIEGSVDVDAHAAAAPGVTVHADDNIVPLVETSVEGDTLVVRLRHGASFRTHGPLKVDVEFTQLTATEQRGSGDLNIAGLTGTRLESSIEGSGDLKIERAQLGSLKLSIAGSGDAKLEGKADEADFQIEGSGDISAGDLVARRVTASIAGSGDAHVNATEALEAHVAGSGDVRYRGHPHDLNRRVGGSGSVEADD